MPRSPIIDYIKRTKSSITTATSSAEKHFGEVPDEPTMRAWPKKALHLDAHLHATLLTLVSSKILTDCSIQV